MKKFTGNYSSDAGKALKSAGGRLFCRIDEDGMIYTCTGYFVYRMRPDEYAATVQPVTKCDPGNWIIENGEKREAGPADFDVIKTFRDTVNACTGEALNRCPADFAVDKGGTLSSYYSPAGFAAFYNQLYTSPLYSGLTIRANSAAAPAVFYDGEEAVAMVLPVRAKPDAARAVKAFFTAEQAAEDKPAETNAAELETIRAELDAARDAAQAAEIERAAMGRRDARRAGGHEKRRRDHSGPVYGAGRRAGRYQGRRHRRAGGMACRRYRKARRRDPRRRCQVERQAQRLLYPRRLN